MNMRSAGRHTTASAVYPAHRFCVAPMMDWTDRHCRYFHRLLSRHALLYTEMVTTGALIHGDRERFLRFDPSELPLALQLGGSEPAELAYCAKLAEQWGYSEINLNCGCPSDRVQSGRMGACLMAEPALVGDCLAAMRSAVSIPVTLKCRIGIDEMDSDAALLDFVGEVLERSACTTWIVHARTAWLQGLSPKENREVPPLNYARVFLLKRTFPEIEVVINGGIQNLDQAEALLEQVDGVMLGRAAYQNPWLLSEVDRRLFGAGDGPSSPHAVVESLLPYIEREMAQGSSLKHISRHILGLFQGVPGAKRFRRHLSERAHLPDAGPALLREALTLVPDPRRHHAVA